MRQEVGHVQALRVDGGASANNLLMQIQADLLAQPVVRPSMLETTAAGAAFLAGIGAGIFPSVDAIREAWQEERRFTPEPSPKTEALLKKWQAAVPKT